ncbi:MAG: hypothetical protein AB7H81_00920 [Vicinamibacterales bacterium]
MNRFVLAALLGVAGIATVAAVVTTRQAATDEGPAVAIILPERSAPDPPDAAPVPAVPANADAIDPIAYTLVTTWQGGPAGKRTTEQDVTRTRTRAHLVLDGGRREWLFERNPVHPDRVAGYLIDHDAKEIHVHHDSDLRSTLHIRGWADVVMMRFDPKVLSSLRETGERRTVAGAEFRRFVAGPDAGMGVVEVWWSEALLLPLASTSRESGSVTVDAMVERLSNEIDSAVLADPAVRFPAYEVLDASDARDHRS